MKKTGANRRLAKKRAQWLNEALCFVSSLTRPEKSLQLS